MCYFCLSYFIISTISKVLLVGGSSKIPLVSELLVNQLGFPVHKLNHSVNADEAVARGAAVFAAQLSDRCPVQLDIHFCSVLLFRRGEFDIFLTK